MKKIYLGQLERFGYTLTAIGPTKKEVESSLMAEYETAYKNANGCDPREDYYDDWDERSYYDVAKDEIYVEEMTVGKVIWM